MMISSVVGVWVKPGNTKKVVKNDSSCSHCRMYQMPQSALERDRLADLILWVSYI